jgi:hypothetical protein
MSKLAQRIAKLERSRGNGYVASRFLHGSSEMTAADYERLRKQTLDEMVAAGEITEQQRNKVFLRGSSRQTRWKDGGMDRQSRGARSHKENA